MTWFIEFHAMQRMKEMNIERSEVTKALDNPETDYPSPPKYGRDFRMATRGRVAVVYHPERRTVTTVLWNQRESRSDGPG